MKLTRTQKIQLSADFDSGMLLPEIAEKNNINEKTLLKTLHARPPTTLKGVEAFTHKNLIRFVDVGFDFKVLSRNDETILDVYFQGNVYYREIVAESVLTRCLEAIESLKAKLG